MAGIWPGAAPVALEAFLIELPLVGHERGNDSGHALAWGFEPLGPLRVHVLKNVV